MKEQTKASTSTSASESGNVQEAERLRLAGNDAFKTKDWERALELYQSSNVQAKQAKTYANLAATLLKISKYSEAADAAKQATLLDPGWAKGWWRRGVVAALEKQLAEALKFYSKAVELEPNTPAFKKAKLDMEKRLKIVTGETYNGMPVMDSPKTTAIGSSPGFIVWKRARALVGDDDVAYWKTHHYHSMHQKIYPTSEQWIMAGMHDYVCGMRCAIAELITGINPTAGLQHIALTEQGLGEDDYCNACYQLLGGVCTGDSLQTLSAGLATLGGQYFLLHIGGAETNSDTAPLCPQPGWLRMYPDYQLLGLLWSIDVVFADVLSRLGRNMPCCQAVLAASGTLFENLQSDYRHDIQQDSKQDPSAAQVVAYIKQQLKNGKTWDKELRKYCLLNYRGPYMYAQLLKLIGGPGGMTMAYKFEKWAREFITLADAEFSVSKVKAYEEKGTSFRPSFRIGMMMTELISLTILRGDAINGPYSMEMSLDLCVEIADMAKDMDVPRNARSPRPDYTFSIMEVSTRRKPLALAHGAIASQLIRIQSLFSLQEFKQIATHHGLIEDRDLACDPFAIIAEHYKIAAENELPDAEHAAIYWWGYAAYMAQTAPDDRYTLGELKRAIAMAQAAEEARDVGLWGENKQRGATYETVAMLTAQHFADEQDSFVLNQVKIVQEESKTSLRVGDNVICTNFREYELKDLLRAKDIDHYPELDTSELQKEHGPSSEGVPSLETLSVRALHRADFEHARGETDGAVIHEKALKAAAGKENP